MRYSRSVRFSKAKPTGSFRVYHPSSRRVAALASSLHEARTDAAFWSKQTPNPLEIQERFPSGKWVTVEMVNPKSLMKGTAGSKRAHATKKMHFAFSLYDSGTNASGLSPEQALRALALKVDWNPEVLRLVPAQPDSRDGIVRFWDIFDQNNLVGYVHLPSPSP